MPIFEYKAYAAGGSIQSGVIDADTSREARTRLRKDNLLVKEIKELRGGKSPGKQPKSGKLAWVQQKLRERQRSSGPSARNLDVLTASTRQMGTLLGSGIPLTETLKAMIEQAESRSVETMFREIRERVNQGTALAEALSEHPYMFSELYVNMVRAGEATGNVDVVLRRLADYLQGQRTLRRKVVSALTYPALMIGIGMIVVSILMAVVVPKITDHAGRHEPDAADAHAHPDHGQRPVQELVVGRHAWRSRRSRPCSSASTAARTRAACGSTAACCACRSWAISCASRPWRASRARSRRCLQSGVPAVQSLEITKTVVGNRVIADATDTIRKRILEGTDIATPLKQTGVFPAVVGYMVSVGEQSGELEQMLDRIASAYDEEIDISTERLTSVLEPIMIVFLAVVVGYIVISIVLPILQIGQIGK